MLVVFQTNHRAIANATVNNSQEPSKTCSKCFLLLQSSFKTKVLERYNSLRVLHILWQTFHSRLDIESYFDLSTETCPCRLLVSGWSDATKRQLQRRLVNSYYYQSSMIYMFKETDIKFSRIKTSSISKANNESLNWFPYLHQYSSYSKHSLLLCFEAFLCIPKHDHSMTLMWPKTTKYKI